MKCIVLNANVYLLANKLIINLWGFMAEVQFWSVYTALLAYKHP